jgi:hypothetical protein
VQAVLGKHDMREELRAGPQCRPKANHWRSSPAIEHLPNLQGQAVKPLPKGQWRRRSRSLAASRVWLASSSAPLRSVQGLVP